MSNSSFDGTPPQATPLQVTAVAANAVCTATFPAAVGKTNYVQGVVLSTGGATVGLLASVTLAGLSGGTITLPLSIPTGPLLGCGPHVIPFPRAMRGVAPNTAVSVSIPALGAGNTSASATLIGFVV
jgi:hypothetical protein